VLVFPQTLPSSMISCFLFLQNYRRLCVLPKFILLCTRMLINPLVSIGTTVEVVGEDTWLVTMGALDTSDDSILNSPRTGCLDMSFIYTYISYISLCYSLMMPHSSIFLKRSLLFYPRLHVIDGALIIHLLDRLIAQHDLALMHLRLLFRHTH